MSAKKLLLAQYDLHNVLFNNVIVDISNEESNKCVADPMNSVKWLAGHLLWANANLANIGGTKVEVKWRDHFHTKQGGSAEDFNAPESVLPTLEEVKNKWNEDAPVIRMGLENMPEEALNSVVEFKHPILPFDNTLAGLWAFINHHQAYTIGQIGILRRGLGKEAMSYFKS
ncbi:MAG TPA: DinB family protein [Mucilaginibacter sp.]|nr:DinB family protein [Mucilaginibacter sp.]